MGLPVAAMQAILGAFLLYICWSPQITVGKPTNKRFFILGVVGAFISMFIGATGSLLAPWVRGVSEDRREFVATLACIMMFVHGLKAVVFRFLGFAFMTYLPLMAAMVVAGFIGNWLGFKLLTVMREDVFKRLFQIALTVLSVRLLWSAAEKSGFF